MKRTALVLCLLALLCLPTWATDYAICFTRIDADYDGEMTQAEFDQAFPGGDTAVFRTADSDQSGTVSHDEWEEFKSSQGFEEGDHHG